MKESKLLGTLLPSSPDFLPIVEAIREKYGLPEISPDDNSITEIFLGDDFVSLENFRKDIENHIRENLTFLTPKTLNFYISAKTITELQNIKDIETLPDEMKKVFEEFIKLMKQMMSPFVQLIDGQIQAVSDMLYIYILTGETEELPNEWFSQASKISIFGEPIVIALAGQMTDPEVTIQQFRREYKKAFGAYHPKVTKTATSTAYYLRLKRMGKPWKYIVEEYIRLNKLSLPRDRNSKKYYDTLHKYEQRLKKQMQRTEATLEILLRDKK